MKMMVPLAVASLAMTLAACSSNERPTANAAPAAAESSSSPNLNTTVMHLNESPVDGFAPPAADPPKQLADRYNWLHLQWNGRDLDKATGLMASQITYKDHASGKVYKTPDEWETAQDSIFSASSNAKLTNRVYWHSGNLTISKFTLEGTNDKPYMGHAATNKKFSVDAAEIVKWGGGGKVTGGDLYYDRLGVMMQLGTMTPPPTPPPAPPSGNASPKPKETVPTPAGLSTTPPSTILERDRWGHDWWNARNLQPFLPLFDPVFYYVDHPTGKIVSTVPQMNEFASGFWGVTSNGQMVDRTYYQAGNLTLATFTVKGTNDRMPNGKQPTNKNFALEGAEFIYWSSEGKGVGGDMYFDRLTVLNQLGFVPPGFPL